MLSNAVQTAWLTRLYLATDQKAGGSNPSWRAKRRNAGNLDTARVSGVLLLYFADNFWKKKQAKRLI